MGTLRWRACLDVCVWGNRSGRLAGRCMRCSVNVLMLTQLMMDRVRYPWHDTLCWNRSLTVILCACVTDLEPRLGVDVVASLLFQFLHPHFKVHSQRGEIALGKDGPTHCRT
jgi:hypothetical protein